MAKATSKPAAKLAESETLNGSNTLPAMIEIGPDKSVALGEIVRLAHQESGLTVEDWNSLAEAERDALLNWTLTALRENPDAASYPAVRSIAAPAAPLESVTITTSLNPELYDALVEQIRTRLAGMDAEVAQAALDELQRAVDALGTEKLPYLPDPMPMMLAERMLILSAPAGPRRRAGIALGPVPLELRWDEFVTLCGHQDPATVMELLSADPLIKIDGRMIEREAQPDEYLSPEA